MAGETLCYKPLPPAAVSAEAAQRPAGSRAWPPCSPGSRELSVLRTTTQQGSPSRCSDPGPPRPRLPRHPCSRLGAHLNGEYGEKAVGSNSVDSQARFGIPVPEASSPPSVRCPSPSTPAPESSSAHRTGKKLAAPRAGSRASPTRLTTLVLQLGEVIKKKKFSSPGGPTGQVLQDPWPQPPPPPSAPRGVLEPAATKSVRPRSTARGKAVYCICTESVGSPGDQK